ncbi:PREDICTED: GDNF family receptor alpha-like [Dipodomys ordii]|uniref:GDNF family receptor alpha-like n=1 Tax=Dipodomys ordii TaxID=10020 RepID=A0A1S3FEX6_DIPOR|nr:PREDICTED: GDNF family receptor alpha-like [Dipodomys ordii]
MAAAPPPASCSPNTTPTFMRPFTQLPCLAELQSVPFHSAPKDNTERPHLRTRRTSNAQSTAQERPFPVHSGHTCPFTCCPPFLEVNIFGAAGLSGEEDSGGCTCTGCESAWSVVAEACTAAGDPCSITNASHCGLSVRALLESKPWLKECLCAGDLYCAVSKFLGQNCINASEESVQFPASGSGWDHAGAPSSTAGVRAPCPTAGRVCARPQESCKEACSAQALWCRGRGGGQRGPGGGQLCSTARDRLSATRLWDCLCPDPRDTGCASVWKRLFEDICSREAAASSPLLAVPVSIATVFRRDHDHGNNVTFTRAEGALCLPFLSGVPALGLGPASPPREGGAVSFLVWERMGGPHPLPRAHGCSVLCSWRGSERSHGAGSACAARGWLRPLSSEESASRVAWTRSRVVGREAAGVSSSEDTGPGRSPGPVLRLPSAVHHGSSDRAVGPAASGLPQTDVWLQPQTPFHTLNSRHLLWEVLTAQPLERATPGLTGVSGSLRLWRSRSCWDVTRACLEDLSCNARLAAYLAACPARGGPCAPRPCQAATRRFYESLPPAAAQALALCTCDPPDDHALCQQSQDALHGPRCARPARPRTCLQVMRSCRRDRVCRERYRTFQAACWPRVAAECQEDETCLGLLHRPGLRCSGSRGCRAAFVGTLGTALHAPCTCQAAAQSQELPCRAVQHLLRREACFRSSVGQEGVCGKGLKRSPAQRIACAGEATLSVFPR